MRRTKEVRTEKDKLKELSLEKLYEAITPRERIKIFRAFEKLHPGIFPERDSNGKVSTPGA